MEKIRNNPLPVIFFTVFVDLIGFGILIPIIPLLLADPGSPYYLLPVGFSIQSGYVLLGFLTATFPLMQFVATPILGQLSDKFGRKKILAVSLLGTCLSYLIFAFGIVTRNIPLLFAARAFDGITGGNIAVAQAAIADVTTPTNRAKNFGLIGAAFGLGFILGPYIGGKLSDPTVVSWFSAPTPFLFAAILSFLNVLSVLFIFPETLKVKMGHVVINWTKSIKNVVHAYGMRELRPLFISFFLFQSGFGFFVTFFSVFLITRFGFNQGNIGDYFSYVGLWVAFTQAVITRLLSRRLAEYQILRVSILGMGMVMPLYFLPTVWWQLLFIAPFFAMFNGLSQANSAGLISRSVDNSVQGEILGINASVQALAQAIPPMLSGFIAAKLSPETPILVGSTVIICGWIVFMLFHKPVHPIHVPED